MARSRILLNSSYVKSVVNFRGPLIAELIAAGHDVHVTAPNVGGPDRADIESLGARVHTVPLRRTSSNPLHDWRYYRAMRRLIARLQPDLVIGYTIKPNIWGSLAAQAEGRRSASMVTGLGHVFMAGGGLKRRLVKKLSCTLYRRATAANEVVIFQNPDDIRDFREAGCLADSSKARRVWGSGVDTRHFALAPLPDRPVFLMAARLLADKGVREFARAAMSIMAERDDCQFLLAGDFDEAPSSIGRDELDEWTRAGIEWLGWLPDVRGAMSEASVYVLPSYREGTPRTILEASAMGRPAITTDVPGCRETVIHGETGLLVPVKDVAALRDAMVRLADDSNLRAEMGSRARAYCVERYAVEKVNRELLGHLGLAPEEGNADRS